MLKRAFYYITRKRGKTLILFTILLIIATFVLTGISVLQAANASALSLRQSLGGSIKLELDETRKENWNIRQFSAGGIGGTVVEYLGTPITDEDIAKALSVNGVTGYNGVSNGSIHPVDFNLIPGNLDSLASSIISSQAPEKQEKASSYTLLPSTTYSERFNYFARGAFKLTEGRHIVAEDTYAALISDALAEHNNLTLGDKITVQNADSRSNYPPVTLTIIGIYEFTGISAVDSDYNTSSTLKLNRVVIGHTAMKDITGKSKIEYDDGVDFYVNDPKDIDNIAASIRNLDLDWNCFKLTVDNSAYVAVASSLEAMQSLVRTLVIVISIASIAILAIILTMWTRSRVHETGIYLAIGKSKAAILSQHLIEVLLIAVLAFALSFFTSGLVAQGASNILFNQSTVETAEPVSVDDIPDGAYADISGQFLPYDTSEMVTAESIVVEVSSSSLIAVYLLGTVIIMLSVAIASILVLRMKPKEILTQMS